MDLIIVLYIFYMFGVYLAVSRSIPKQLRRNSLGVENNVSSDGLHSFNNIEKLDQQTQVLEDLSRGKCFTLFRNDLSVMKSVTLTHLVDISTIRR